MQSKGNKGMILQDRVCDNEKEVEMEINQRLVKGDGYRQTQSECLEALGLPIQTDTK